MSKIMLVNVTHVEESRVATLEDGVLCAYEIETINRTNLKGNIYNAVVESVHPSLEAAFVKIGSDLKGFLPMDEVNFHLLPARTDNRKLGRIGQHLHPGQKLMAQVVREPFAGKPPTISTYFSLPGRFLVLMPGVDSSGVSRKIEDAKQRDRLVKLVADLNVPEGFGIIVRTAGMGQTKTELQRDLRYLLRLWESIQRSSGGTDFPGLVYREADLVIRTIRDHYTPDVDEVWIDSEDTYEKALSFVRDVMPTRAKTLKLHTGERPLFTKFNLEEQIERIYMRRVPLPSGGEIVIDGTEALTAIDVNSARSRRKGDAEETALATDMEAATEIARQLRLRDQGGLIVVDFIDLNLARNKTKVEKALREAMKGDKAKVDITKMSKLGLVEIARQRLKGAKLAASYATCPICAGHGLIKNVEAAALAALRKLQARRPRNDLAAVRMMLPPEVAVWMLNNKRAELSRIEGRQGIRLSVEPRESLLRHEVTFENVPREPGEAPPTPIASTATASREAGERNVGKAPARESGAQPGAAHREGGARAPEAERGSPDKVVAFPAAPAEKARDASTDVADEESSGDDTRPRKRRRRRRRSRGAGEAKEDDAAQSEPRPRDEEPAQPAPVRVPQGVRADELMPAAVAGSRRKPDSSRGRRATKSPRGRGGARRRKSGGRSGDSS